MEQNNTNTNNEENISVVPLVTSNFTDYFEDILHNDAASLLFQSEVDEKDIKILLKQIKLSLKDHNLSTRNKELLSQSGQIKCNDKSFSEDFDGFEPPELIYNELSKVGYTFYNSDSKNKWKIGHVLTKIAAENGNGEAMHNLGIDYMRGLGCEKNLKLACKWLSKSSVKGIGLSKSKLEEALRMAKAEEEEKNSKCMIF
ncbi:unnamed protein product [Blepharisma stoltei]|uniref:Uncharacterized protein n=1 Tax=Blepharisma stoltei TaxID=1481888 RepID=A0AAU9K901_9CILI|nr:unnamed protein product [Blepharisma stoltei]